MNSLHHEDFQPTLVRVETEFSIQWIVKNPELFIGHLKEFFDKNHCITYHSTPGFLTLIGNSKENVNLVSAGARPYPE